MSNKINEYLAKKIMVDLRSNQSIDDELLKDLTQTPQIDYIRAEVDNNDIDILLRLAHTDRDVLRSFVIGLLRKVKDDERVKSFIFDTWNNAQDADIMLKLDLMWRLLDYTDIDSSVHREIYDFIKKNWTVWLEDVKHSFGGENILDNITKRLTDSTFPETKKWISLCVSVASTNIEGVERLLSTYKNPSDAFVSEVVKYLQDKLMSKN